jgi:hypothetical protein
MSKRRVHEQEETDLDEDNQREWEAEVLQHVYRAVAEEPGRFYDALLQEAAAAGIPVQDARYDGRFRHAVRRFLQREFGTPRTDVITELSPYAFVPVLAVDEQTALVQTPEGAFRHALLHQEGCGVVQRSDSADADAAMRVALAREATVRALAEPDGGAGITRTPHFERVVCRNPDAGAVIWGGCGPTAVPLLDLLPRLPKVETRLACLFQVVQAFAAARWTHGITDAGMVCVMPVGQTAMANRTWVYTLLDAGREARVYALPPAAHGNWLVRLRLRPASLRAAADAMTFEAFAARVLDDDGEAEHLAERLQELFYDQARVFGPADTLLALGTEPLPVANALLMGLGHVQA